MCWLRLCSILPYCTEKSNSVLKAPWFTKRLSKSGDSADLIFRIIFTITQWNVVDVNSFPHFGAKKCVLLMFKLLQWVIHFFLLSAD